MDLIYVTFFIALYVIPALAVMIDLSLNLKSNKIRKLPILIIFPLVGPLIYFWINRR